MHNEQTASLHLRGSGLILKIGAVAAMTAMLPTPSLASALTSTAHAAQLNNENTNNDRTDVSVLVAKPKRIRGTDQAIAGDDVINVLDGNTVNEHPATLENVKIEVGTLIGQTKVLGSVPKIDSRGMVDIPTDIPPGQYVLTYRMCDIVNPAECASSNITIEVEHAPKSK